MGIYTKYFFLVLSAIIIFSSVVRVAYADREADLKVEVKMPEIGFLTIGDDVQVTVTVNNYSDQTKYFNVTGWWRPDTIDGINKGEWDIELHTIPAHSFKDIPMKFIARSTGLYWLIVDANGFNDTSYLGYVVGGDNSTRYYIHPTSDRDTRILAESTKNIYEESLKTPLSTSIAVGAAVASAGVAAVFGFLQTRSQSHLRKMESLQMIFQWLSNEEIRAHRRAIYDEYCQCKQEGKELDFNRTDELRNHADSVLSSFDKASVVVLDGLVDYKQFVDLYSDMFLRSWVALEKDIKLQVETHKNDQAVKSYRKVVNRLVKEGHQMPEVYCRKDEGAKVVKTTMR